MRIDHPPQGVRFYGVPATRLAEELGRKVVLNIVMVGFFGAVTDMLDPDSLRKAVADSVPPAMQKLNLAGLRQRLRVRLRPGQTDGRKRKLRRANAARNGVLVYRFIKI